MKHTDSFEHVHKTAVTGAVLNLTAQKFLLTAPTMSCKVKVNFCKLPTVKKEKKIADHAGEDCIIFPVSLLKMISFNCTKRP